jgi:hypothetical protein
MVFIRKVKAKKRRTRENAMSIKLEQGMLEKILSNIFITGSMINESGLNNFRPPAPLNPLSSNEAIRAMIWNLSSTGRSTMTAQILKKSWTMLAENARLNSTLLVIWPKDTSVLVMVVPIFAPMIIGIDVSSDNAPPATRPTTIDVVVDELCIRLVATIPIINPANGFDVIWINDSAKPLPNSLKE